MKKYRLCLLFGLIVSLVLQSIQITYGDSNDDGVKVTTSSLIFDSKGYAHVLGEVINNGKGSVDNVFVIAIFYDDHRSVASNHAFIQMNNLRPGEKSGFEMVLEDIVNTRETLEFDRYELSVESRKTGPKFACLSLNVIENFLDDAGRYHISGTVANDGNQLTDSIKVAATFYNATGHVTAIDATEDDKEEILQPKEYATFDLIGTPIRGSAISSYSINVESRQYSMVNPAVTRENIECPYEPSTSLTLYINSTTSNSLTQDLLVSGSVTVPMESEKYVVFEIYNEDGKLYDRESCELDEDSSYLCNIRFYHLGEDRFVLKARYGEALAETTFARLGDSQGQRDENGAFGSVRQYSKIVLDDGEIIPVGSSIKVNMTDQVSDGNIPRVSRIDIETTVSNDNSTNAFQPISLIVQITNGDGITVFLKSQNMILSHLESVTIRTDWEATEEGVMTIDVFVWDSIDESPIPLVQANKMQVFLTNYLLLDDSLKAYWDFENLTNDKTGNGNEAEAYSGVDFVSGFKGKAAQFDAINGDYIKIPDSSTIDVCAADCTATAWVKLASMGGRYGIIGNHHGGGENGWIMIIKETSNVLSLWSKPSEGLETFVDGNTALSADTWYFIAFTRSGNTVTLYIDGVLDATGTVSGDLTRTSSPFYIGTLREDSNNFDGIIDEVTLHDRALSSTEVSRLYNER